MFWILKLHQVIYPRSPPLWERLKAMLGVPLDIGFTDGGRMEGIFLSGPGDNMRKDEFLVEEIHAQLLPPPHANNNVEDADDASSVSSTSSTALRDSVRGLCIIAASSPNPPNLQRHGAPQSPLSPSHTPSKLRFSTTGDYSRPLSYGHTPNNSLAQGPSPDDLRRVRERRDSTTPHFVADFAHLCERRLSVDVATGA